MRSNNDNKNFEHAEAKSIKQAIIDGYEDLVAGRTVTFSGDLMADLKRTKAYKKPTK